MVYILINASGRNTTLPWRGQLIPQRLLKNRLKIIAVPKYIATLTEERESSWNNGYDESISMTKAFCIVHYQEDGGDCCVSDAFQAA